MVALLIDDRAAIISPNEGEQTKPPRFHYTCLCVIPLAVVAAGAILVGVGRLCSSSDIARNILTTMGMAVYIIGVVYFVIINLADRSCEQEEESDSETLSDVFTNETVELIITESTSIHSLNRT
ncbi:hypothetical protein OS493_015693 [Desmophyllum pertusum]|uniref:Uncharacterized protein n=1 Tax=Desmophyllum pertusum TaxID=174260 RepID=A0A9W9YQR0_9CNID|nr:hypothetical protein OS493_015693 [Desmophyllum pertusum]